MDEQVWLVNANSDIEPGETYIFNRKTHKLTLQYKVREKLPREALAEMKPLRYNSSDGLEIPGYLTLPKGMLGKNLPTIIFPHGGPWGRDTWGYNGYAQFFANRGYAVLSMNFRGSTGYGKKFLDGGNKEWGRKMQDDVSMGREVLSGRRHCRSQACRHLRRFLWRVCHACRRGLYAGSLCGRSGSVRALQIALR